MLTIKSVTAATIAMPKRNWRLTACAMSALAVSGLGIIAPQAAMAEGSFQMGLTQPLLDQAAADTDRYIKVDILAGGEVININACGQADTDLLQYTIYDSNLIQVNQSAAAAATVTCTSPMNTTLTGGYEYVAPSAGTYYVTIDNQTNQYLNRYDITVTPNAATNPDPTGASGITGRVSAEQWYFNAGNYTEATSTDADYYILTPGGFPNTNYVWQLDLNNFAGYVYDLKANNHGVDDPFDGFSTPRAGNTVTQDFDIYINYPDVANPLPSMPAQISNFQFTDSAGQNNTISPGGTAGVQDTGVFTFDTDATTATYSIYIDVNQDGIYGNAGDVQLNGPAVFGTNTIPFDGNDNNGNPLPIGVYEAQAQVRLGEFHFVAADAETSGGGANATGNGDGLTVFQADSGGGTTPTLVYWDDITVLGAGAGGTSSVPAGALSGTAAGYHTWGDFTATSFGNNNFIDTYVYGDTTFASGEVGVVDDDDYMSALVDITDTTTPGQDLALEVIDSDSNNDSVVIETIIVTVTNDVTGETETVTLTETGPDTGIFTAVLPSAFGTAAGTSDDGTMTTQATDTVTISYDDPNNALGNPETRTDTGNVIGGADGNVTITPSSNPGDTLDISVNDADLVGAGVLDVTVINDVTGESELITLTESPTAPGVFEGTVDTTFGLTAGTDNDGTFNSKLNDTITVTYDDALQANGGTAALTATDTVGGGADGTVTITPNSVPGDTLDITVTDADLAGTGTLVVNATNPDTGETETVTLTESATTPGLFEGTVDTVFGAAAGTNDDGTFNTEAGETVVVTYNDVFTAQGGTAAPTATDTVGGGVNGTVTITPTSQPGDTLDISVTDADLAGTGTLIVNATNPSTGETEAITLTENPGTPGLFEGTVDTVFGAAAGTNDDGTFNTEDGETIVVTYDDALTDTGGTAAPTATDTVSGGDTGLVTITASSVPGDTLDLTLTDDDLIGAGAATVVVNNLTTGEAETITLTESATTPGLFEGTIPTTFGAVAGTNEDGTLTTQNGDDVRITYLDAITDNGQSGTAIDQGVVTGGATGTVTITPASVPGDALAITVTDADLAGTGTLVVSATNPATGETETVTLTESATTPGFFEGSVATTFGNVAGTNDDGTFNTQSGDTVVVTYADSLTDTGGTASPTATDTVGGGADGVVTITPSSAPGEPLAITVTDADLAGDGSLTLTAVNPATGESETLTLTESATTPGLFEGSINTTFGNAAGTDDDGIFNTQNGDTVVVTYDDLFTSTGGTASPTATDTVTGGVDGTVSITPSSAPGDTLAISVNDTDLSGDGTLTVNAVNPATGESETIVLTESATTPGLFEGSVDTVFGTVAGTNDDGAFNTQNGDTVVVTYVDNLTAAGDTANRTDTDSVGGGDDGVVTITPNSVPGDTLDISVTDADLVGTGTLVVNATNPSTGETEAITLTESATTPGLFEGTVDTVFGAAAGTNDDGTFNTENGETIVVTYDDAFTSTGGVAAPTATDTVGGGAAGTVTITPASTPGDTLAVSVTDADLAGTGTLVVVAINPATGESEAVTLTETSPGVFEGTVDTVFGTVAGADDDGTFNTQNGDTVVVTYNDALTDTGATANPTATDTVGGGVSGVVTITPSSVPGDTLAISVTDADLSGDGTLVVNATNPSTGETEVITLTETSPGVFEGSVDTVFGAAAGTNDDGTFNTESGETIVVTYNDALTDTGGTDAPTATDTVGGGVDGTVSITPTSTPGDTVAINVTDADLAGSGTLNVVVTNPATGELETVTLTETSPGVFDGTLDTVFGPAAGTDNDGTINTESGETLVVTYDDALTSTGGTASPTDTNLVGGGGDGIVTITPNSVPGDTLDITVLDSDLAGTGTLVVNATNPDTGETEAITLTESVTTPGLFEGTVDTVFGPAAGTNDDGTFNTESGETVVVTYNDALTSTGGTNAPTATDTVGGGVDGTVTITPSSVPGDSLTISVSDADLSGDGTLVVATTNPATGETENVILTETSPGVFEGTVDTVFGTIAGTNDDGTYNTQNGDTVIVTYDDALTSTGGTAAPTATDTVGGGADGTVTITPASVPGDTLDISVTDADLANTGTLVVNATNPDTGEVEAVTLTETSPGVFEGTVDTVFGAAAGTDNDGTFNTENGESVVVTYNDALTSTGGTNAPTATDTVGGGNDGTVTITPASVPGDTLDISVTDADLAGTGTLVVNATNPDTGEVEAVTLTETTPGVFEGTVDTVFGAAAGTDNDGTFNTENGESVIVTYNDALTSTGGTNAPTATDTVGGGADGTVTITPASVPGDTLDISVTDADLAGTGTLTVNATNPSTGETESVTLTETAPGVFEGTVDTVFGVNAGPNDDGTFNTENGETVVVTYNDALTSTGGTNAPTATDTVGGGADGTVSITPSSAPGDTLTVSVTDADLAGTGTLVVNATNPNTGETESLTLTETTPGAFEGTVDTVFGDAAGTNDDGTFNTQSGDTVIVTYNDALTSTGGTNAPTATDNVIGGGDGTVSITPTSVPGDTLDITVTDGDLAGTGTLVVTAVNPSTGESEDITLTENPAAPGLFEGTVDTMFGAAAGTNNDGTFNTENGETIVVTYNDAATATGGTASPTATDTVSGGETGTVTITPASVPGDALAISVTDGDLAGAGSIIVTAVNPATGESEAVTLFENAVMPGLFEGSVDTAFGTTAGTNDDGTFNTQSGDTVTVTYLDALTDTGATAAPTATDNVGGGNDGSVTITPASVPGDTLAISVTDADLAGAGTITVTAENVDTGESETVTLTETSPGVFESTVDTTFGTAAGTDDDGTFNTQSGDTVTVTYLDALTSTGGTATPSADDSVGGGADGTVSITPSSAPGDPLAISVSDADLTGTGTLIVTALNPNTGESEAVTLTETSPGVFDGSVDTTFGTAAGTDDDGTFNTQSGDTVVVTYNDDLTSTGGTNTPTATDNVIGGGDGTVSITPNSVPGDTLDVTVTDADLAGTGTLVVTAVNPATGESEDITLTESPTAPGLFEGTVDTVFGTSAGTDNDGTFNTENGETIVVTYNDAATSTGGTASPTATDTVGGGSDGTVTITPASVPGDTLAISVTDADLAGTGTLVVNATNPDTGELEAVTLTETTPGAFEGSVDTVFGADAGTDNDGTFNTENGENIIVTYNDALTSTGGTDAPTATDSVGGGVDGTVTITPSFTPGDTVAVSVTDADLAGTGTLVVNVENPATGETEAVTLTETSPGVFEGTVDTVFGTTSGADDDGTFNTQTGDTLVVTYTDALTSTGGTDTPEATGTVGGGNDGSVTITPSSIPGDTLDISVTDADLAGTGTLVVNATNPDTGETESVTLTETSPGVFEGTVDTVFGTDAGTNDDGTFNTENGETIVVTYDDVLTSTGATDTLTATDTVGGGVDGTVSITPSSTPGDTLTVSVTDADLTGTGTLVVTAVNANTGESEAITLTETTPGVFEGTVDTVFGTDAGTDDDGIFHAQTGDVITVTYNDALTSTGGTASPTADDLVSGGGDAVITLTPSSVPGDTLTVTVADQDENVDPAIVDTLTVDVVNTDTGESETLTLTETGPDTGVFTATIDTVLGDTAGTDNDGVINTTSSDTLVATYVDAVTSTGSSNTITATDNVLGMTVVKTASLDMGADGVASVGDVVTYSFAVSNTSDVALSNVTITDALAPVSGTLATLAAGATDTATFTSTYALTQTDIDAGSVENTATADATGPGGAPISAVSDDPTNTADVDADGDGNPSDPTVTTLDAAGTLAITKAGVLDKGADSLLNAGDTITYNFTVTNTGNVTLTDVSIDDPMVTVSGAPIASLPVGASDTTTFTALYTITQADIDAGGVTNTATANGTTPGGDPVVGVSDDPSNTADVDADGDGNPSDPTVTELTTAPAMFLTKTGVLNDGGDGVANVGDTIDYTFAITNTGEVSLTVVTVTDPMVTVAGGPLTGLAPGETDSSTFTASYTLTQEDINSGGVTNTATATANDPNGNQVVSVSDDPNNPDNVDPDGDGNPSDPTVTSLPEAPSLAFVKAATLDVGADGVANVGDTITYNFSVTNTGNVQVNSITVFDPIVTVSGGPITSLNAGETDATTFSAVYTLTQADIDNGEVTNTATATGATPSGQPVTGVSDNPADPTNDDPDGDGNPSDPTVTALDALPSLAVTKAATLNDGGDGFADIGDTISYVFTVVNAGNVSLNNVTINDPIVAVNGGPIATLMAGASDATTFTANYTLTQADLDAGSVTNTATATGQTPGGMTVTGVSDDPSNPTDADADGDGNPSDPTVTPLSSNLPAVAGDDSSSTQIGVPVAIPVITNDNDPEGGALTISSVTQPDNGTVTFDPDGTVIYTPNPDFVGVDTFTYEVCDVEGRCDTATVTVSVDDDTPTANNDRSGTEPGQPVNIAVLTNDTDPNGDALTVTTATAPGNGTAFINPNGTITYTPNPGFEGIDSFTYTICDELDYCDTATVTVDVNADSPQAIADVTSTPSETPVILTLIGNDTDPNGDVLTIASVTQPANGEAVLNSDGTVTYTPDDDFVGQDIFTYTVCDPDGNCDTATVNVTVDNQIPVAEDDMATTGEDTPVVISVTDNDSDVEGPVTVTAVTTPANGTAVVNPDGTISYTPEDGFFGDDSFTYTVCDSSNECVEALVNVTVTPQAPDITDDVETTEPAVPVIVAVLGNDTDPNGDVLTVTEVTQPTGGTAFINDDGTVTVTPDADFEGDLVMTYTACDSDGNCETADIVVTVDAVTPTANDDNATVPGDTPYGFDPRVNDTDPDGDVLTISDVTQPAVGGDVVINPDGTLTFTPTDGYSGPVEFTYTVCDADGNCDDATVILEVEPPVAGINGVVFLDLNADDARQPGEPLQEGYIVEVRDENGTVVGTDVTDENGFYDVQNLPVGTYDVFFIEPGSATVYGVIEDVELTGGNVTLDQNLPIDPSGVVYNSITRQPVSGVVMTLTDLSGNPLPVECFVDASQQNQTTSADGYYRFDLVPDASSACPATETDYRIQFDAPADFNDTPSLLIAGEPMPLNPSVGVGPLEVQPQITAPNTAQDTTYYLGFVLGSGDRDVINNHIPIDPITVTATPLSITKTTPQRDVSFGELVPYTITVRNTDTTPRINLDIVDTAPPGFRYVADTARIASVPVAVETRGREIIIPNRTLAAGESLSINLMMAVGAGANEGEYINQAQVRSALNGAALSETAQAVVRLVPSPLFDCSEVIGKVFDDKNQDGYQNQGEPGMAGVRIATAKGLLITTDQHGRYHIACAAVPNAKIGSNFILKVDERTLPTGYRMTTENPRVVRLTRGKMSKANFGTSIRRVVTLDLAEEAFTPGTTLMTMDMADHIGRLISVLRDEESVLRLNYHAYEGANGGLSDDRVGSVARHIDDLWESEGCCYQLNIEQKTILPQTGVRTQAQVQTDLNPPEAHLPHLRENGGRPLNYRAHNHGSQNPGPQSFGSERQPLPPHFGGEE